MQKEWKNSMVNDVHIFVNNCNIHPSARLSPFSNLYGCEIGEHCFIGPFVEIQSGVKIRNRTRISSHSFICSGVEIGEDCFIAHGVMFTNDKFTESRENWLLRKTKIGNNVRIGSNSTILPVSIGDNCVIGAGSVVTHDVPPNTTVYGVPAKVKHTPTLDELKDMYEFKP